jgi:hypothetical protein
MTRVVIVPWDFKSSYLPEQVEGLRDEHNRTNFTHLLFCWLVSLSVCSSLFLSVSEQCAGSAPEEVRRTWGVGEAGDSSFVSLDIYRPMNYGHLGLKDIHFFVYSQNDKITYTWPRWLPFPALSRVMKVYDRPLSVSRLLYLHVCTDLIAGSSSQVA